MKLIFKYVVASALLALAGCTALRQPSPTAPTPPSPVTAEPRRMIIFIPQTDQAAQSWLKLFERYPQLRMTIALSPRFARLSKEPPLKEKILELQKAGRLELALQLPNAPLLPLLIDTDLAKTALPPGSPLPVPSFRHPEDVTQIVARAKTEFSRQWLAPPKGLVLPHGAVNIELVNLLNRLNLSWAVGALGTPASGGAYRQGGIALWDATPVQEGAGLVVQVLDERASGNPAKSLQILGAWADNIAKKTALPILPSDPDLPAAELPASGPWGGRSWTTKDWSPWIGSANKNAAWSWLRTTRDALDHFKNSGQASVRRLDMAFEEIYNAENANYFAGINEGGVSDALTEDREREFKATLSSVYRLIGQPPPENLFSSETLNRPSSQQSSSTTVRWETLPDGRGHLVIEDVANDDHGGGQLRDPSGVQAVAGAYDLQRVEIWASAETLDWEITLGSINGTSLGNYQTTGPLIDVYLDLNAQPDVGTVSLLPGRGAHVPSADAWEYAFSLWGVQAQFFRTRGSEAYQMSDTVPLTFEGRNRVRFSVPRSWLRGSPQRWGYQVLAMSYDPKSVENNVRPLITPEMASARRPPVYDLIDPLEVSQSQLLTEIEAGKRTDIPFVRFRSSK